MYTRTLIFTYDDALSQVYFINVIPLKTHNKRQQFGKQKKKHFTVLIIKKKHVDEGTPSKLILYLILSLLFAQLMNVT